MKELKQPKTYKFLLRISEERRKALLMNKARTFKTIELQINEAIDKYLCLK
jgi:hypothetical protein